MNTKEMFDRYEVAAKKLIDVSKKLREANNPVLANIVDDVTVEIRAIGTEAQLEIQSRRDKSNGSH